MDDCLRNLNILVYNKGQEAKILICTFKDNIKKKILFKNCKDLT